MISHHSGSSRHSRHRSSSRPRVHSSSCPPPASTSGTLRSGSDVAYIIPLWTLSLPGIVILLELQAASIHLPLPRLMTALPQSFLLSPFAFFGHGVLAFGFQ